MANMKELNESSVNRKSKMTLHKNDLEVFQLKTEIEGLKEKEKTMKETEILLSN